MHQDVGMVIMELCNSLFSHASVMALVFTVTVYQSYTEDKVMLGLFISFISRFYNSINPNHGLGII